MTKEMRGQRVVVTYQASLTSREDETSKLFEKPKNCKDLGKSFCGQTKKDLSLLRDLESMAKTLKRSLSFYLRKAMKQFVQSFNQ